MMAAFDESSTELSKFLEGQNGSLMMKVEQTETGSEIFTGERFKERLIITLKIFSVKYVFQDCFLIN